MPLISNSIRDELSERSRGSHSANPMNNNENKANAQQPATILVGHWVPLTPLEPEVLKTLKACTKLSQGDPT